MKIVTLSYDQDAESPEEGDCTWKVVSFLDRSGVIYEYFRHDKDGNIKPKTIALGRKIDCGTAFVLSCYDHSGRTWSLKGEGLQCQWDTTRLAGILIFSGKASDLPKGLEARAQDARNFLVDYNNWCHGQVFGYTVEEVVTLPCGHSEVKDVGYGWGFFDIKEMDKEIGELVGADEFTIKGDAQGLSGFMDIVRVEEQTDG